VVITNYKRKHDPEAGLNLVKKLRGVGYEGIVIVYGQSMALGGDTKKNLYTQEKLMCLAHGAHLATQNLELVREVVSVLGQARVASISKKNLIRIMVVIQ